MSSHLLQLYDFLINTLIMICPDFDALSDDDITYYLQELEGDAHTFFDRSNVSALKDAGMLNDEQVNSLANMKYQIESIPSDLWRKEAFMNASSWCVVRDKANCILNALNISKRTLK